METHNFQCKQCGWMGVENELASDVFECCMGPTNIEICPQCGSVDVEALPKGLR